MIRSGRRWTSRRQAPVVLCASLVLAAIVVSGAACAAPVAPATPTAVATGSAGAPPTAADLKEASEWVARYLVSPNPYELTNHWLLHRNDPPDAQSAREIANLTLAITQLPTPRERAAGLDLLACLHPDAVPAVVGPAAENEKDAKIRAAEILLLGLAREAAVLPVLRQHLKDPEVSVRVAAIDALGILHRPSYPIPLSRPSFMPGAKEPMTPCITVCDPPIGIGSMVAWSRYRPTSPEAGDAGYQMIDAPIELGADVRADLEKVMLSAETASEREAAARALVAWPPEKYRLRVAEWGVWIADGGRLQLVQSVLDEIPAFVHGTGNPVGEFADRINQVMMIDKPVVHITVDQPLAVDLQVTIRLGRPWFAYPMPDEMALEAPTRYGMKPGDGTALLKPLDNKKIPPLENLGEGYPWLRPNHRRYGAEGGSMGATGNEIAAMGLHWQSLIVCPKPAPWMKLPAVPKDAKFRWWEDLREVPTSYIASRSEAERFLYYDGPTIARTPMVAKVDGDVITFTPQDLMPEKEAKFLDWGERAEVRVLGEAKKAPTGPAWFGGLFIRVAGGKATAWPLAVPTDGGRVRLAESRPVTGPDAEAALRDILTDAGLARAEADGLIRCWRKQFFGIDGQRFLLRLRPADYDAMCPMTIRPAATEGARVGLVLMELPAAAAK